MILKRDFHSFLGYFNLGFSFPEEVTTRTVFGLDRFWSPHRSLLKETIKRFEQERLNEKIKEAGATRSWESKGTPPMPPQRNKALISSKASLRDYFLGGWHWGVPLGSHDKSYLFQSTKAQKKHPVSMTVKFPGCYTLVRS